MCGEHSHVAACRERESSVTVDLRRDACFSPGATCLRFLAWKLVQGSILYLLTRKCIVLSSLRSHSHGIDNQNEPVNVNRKSLHSWQLQIPDEAIVTTRHFSAAKILLRAREFHGAFKSKPFGIFNDWLTGSHHFWLPALRDLCCFWCWFCAIDRPNRRAFKIAQTWHRALSSRQWSCRGPSRASSSRP